MTKKIDDQGLTSTNSASIGDEINYVITGSVPSRIEDYAAYFYKFTDTLSRGLTYKENSLRVYLKNGDTHDEVTQYFFVHAGEYHEQSGTVITIAMADLKSLDNVMAEGKAKYILNENSQIIITYMAVLNEHALLKDPNTNEVTLIYSNDPNDSGTPSNDPPVPPPSEPTPDVPVGETVKSRTETYTTALSITKTNQEGKYLQGAVFTLTGEGVKQALVTEQVFKADPVGTYYKLKDGTYTTLIPTDETKRNYENTDVRYKKETVMTLKGEGRSETNVQGEVEENGKLIFTGLGAGNYTLIETKAPDGYNKIDPINFTLTFNPESKTFSSSHHSITYVSDEGKLHSTIINYPGSLLPRTGGMGTTILYMIGACLVCVAVIFGIAKKCKRGKK